MELVRAPGDVAAKRILCLLDKPVQRGGWGASRTPASEQATPAAAALRARLARARGSHMSSRKAQQLLGRRGQHASSLLVLSTVVKALLLMVARQASPDVADALREELLLQVRAAAVTARITGQQFSVASIVEQLLPGLHAAVQQACSRSSVSVSADAAEFEAEAAGAPLQHDCSGVLETALTTAACEAQLCSLSLGAPADDGAAAAALNVEQLLQAELEASLMSAQL